MKNYFKYSILISLLLLMAISSANAATIGTTNQANPYESLPTAQTHFMVGAPSASSIATMTDGDLGTSGTFWGAPHLIRPNGDGFYKVWTTGPSTGLGYFAWKEEVSDGDGSYYTSSTAAQMVTSTLDDPPTDASGTISAVKVNIVARRTASAGTLAPMLRLGTTNVIGTTITPTTSYVLYTQTIARPGGGTWSWADITSLEAGVDCIGAGTALRVTQLYVTVEGPTTAYFEFNTFLASPAPFAISFVDLKIKYNFATATTDDSYNIQYAVGSSSFFDLQPTVSGTSSVFDPAAVRPWTQITDPLGAWSWVDISALRVRITMTQGGGSWDSALMSFFDVWATVYTTPLPPAGSLGVSVQPPVVAATVGQTFYVDVYVQGTPVTDLWGYEFTLDYDTNILTATEAFSYYPWLGNGKLTIDDIAGNVYMSYTMGSGLGQNGNSPIARIYFTVDATGTSALALRKGASETILVDHGGVAITRTVYDGEFLLPMFLSAESTPGTPITIDLANPVGTKWHELWPGSPNSNRFTLTTWTDNGDFALSASDQVDMTNATGNYWYHVDTVTTTIHWTFKSPDTGTGAAESTGTFDPASPIGSTWHQILPMYSRTFAITGWTDQGNLVFDPSDQFQITYDDNAQVANAHLDAISTDMQMSLKIAPPPPVPEFPLGLGIIMALAPMIPIVYIWRLRKNKPKPLVRQTYQKGLKQ